MPPRYSHERLADYKKLCGKIGAQVRQARLESNLSQDDMARSLDRSKSWVSAIEYARQGPNILDLTEIANLTGKPIEYFLSSGDLKQGWKQPGSLADWMAIFPGNPERARAHAAVDEVWLGALAAAQPMRIEGRVRRNRPGKVEEEQPVGYAK